MMKLYAAPFSRGCWPRWLLEELGAPYELIQLDRKKQETRTPQYLAVHPLGTVPALVDGPMTLIETSAICLHLADKYADKGLAPPLGTEARARYYQYIVYGVATVEPPVQEVMNQTHHLPEAERSPAILAQSRARFDEVARVITGWLAGKPYLLGERFSAADVTLGAALAWAEWLHLLSGHPELAAYVERLTVRPAYQIAMR